MIFIEPCGQRVMLLRALSKLSICSRQQAKRAIHAGRVQVNGKVIKQPTYWVDLQKDKILLDDEVARRAPRQIYLMLNKPPGYVTTRRDNLHRPTVFDLIPSVDSNQNHFSSKSSWIFPVGRLDYNSAGLLLFTNDGVLGDTLASPESHVSKVYRVLLDRLPQPEEIRRLENGIALKDYITLPATIEFETPEAVAALKESRVEKAGHWLRITIREGKNRQVRRMFAAAGCEVQRLIRVRFGPLDLGDLPEGGWRYLSEKEVRLLRQAVMQRFQTS